jgi:hypothetical protein
MTGVLARMEDHFGGEICEGMILDERGQVTIWVFATGGQWVELRDWVKRASIMNQAQRKLRQVRSELWLILRRHLIRDPTSSSFIFGH